MFDYNNVISFWFDELSPQDWWLKSDELDTQIHQRFAQVHNAAKQCELVYWRGTALGRLAEVIVLDQFSRNIYRDTPAAFASDSLALALSQEAVSIGCDVELDTQQRAFLYMPYMHSESPLIHTQAEQLFKQLSDETGKDDNYQFELKHKAIVDRFGRYPHRNTILGRKSTAEEINFLQQPGSSF